MPDDEIARALARIEQRQAAYEVVAHRLIGARSATPTPRLKSGPTLLATYLASRKGAGDCCSQRTRRMSANHTSTVAGIEVSRAGHPATVAAEAF